MFQSLTEIFKPENSEEILTQIENQKITIDNCCAYFQIGFSKILFSNCNKNNEGKIEGWKHLNSVKSFVDHLISEAVFIEILNLNSHLPQTRDILDIILWILRNQQDQDFTMAVKQHVTEAVEKTKTLNFNQIITVIELFLSKPENIPNEYEIVHICQMILSHLAQLPIPREEMGIKMIRDDLKKVKLFLKLAERNTECSSNTRNVCLERLYKIITSTETEPSPAVSIVLELVGDTDIAGAVNFILSADDITEDSIKRVFITLCKWLHTVRFASQLHVWIIEIMNGLRDREKYDLLLEMTLEVIEKLVKAIVLPVFQPSVTPVVLCMLASVRHTPAVFHKIVPKLPSILKSMKKNTSEQQKITQALVDTISALILHFPNENLYKEIEQELEYFTKSADFRSTLEVTQWTDCSEIFCVNKNVRVGLTNLGNTCYMNSVLQALVMTRQFTRQILLSKHRAPLLIKVQQLLALLLHSKRSELTPKSIFAVRPPDFQSGYQQDSSEYLGYLLDKLHEQENISMNKMIESNEREKMALDRQEDNIKRWPTQESLTDEVTIPDTHSDSSDSGIIVSSSSTSGNNSPLHHNPMAQIDESNAKAVEIKTKLEPKTGPLTSIQKTFNGNICTTYQCMACQSKSSNIDSFRDLQLSFPDNDTINTNDTTNEDDDIVDKNNYSVQNLLDFYCSSEKLDGENQYFCDHCKNLCDGVRSINIVSPPQTLILTLKHFRYDQRYHTRAKLMHKVFHDETITLNILSQSAQSSVQKEIKSVDYALYAAVVHYGVSMDSGHYYTYACDDVGRWYKFNDNIVTNSSLNELHNLSSPNTPYILFYQMKSTVPTTSSIQKKMIKNNCDNLKISNNGSVMDSKDIEGTIKKKPCLIDSRNNAVFYSLPELDELPIELRDFVRQDNTLFAEEMRVFKNKRQHQINKNASLMGRKQNRDNDDDPPNSCGGNQFTSGNHFIY